MPVILTAIFGAVAALAVSFGFGRWLGGLWLVIFVLIMAIVAGLLLLSAMSATHAQAGMGEALSFIFVWLPLFVCGLIGAVIGWAARTYARRASNPPSMS